MDWGTQEFLLPPRDLVVLGRFFHFCDLVNDKTAPLWVTHSWSPCHLADSLCALGEFSEASRAIWDCVPNGNVWGFRETGRSLEKNSTHAVD